MTKENLAKQIMAEYEKDGEPISYDEALEVAEMEIKAGNLKRYEQSSTKKEHKSPTRKTDDDKHLLIDRIHNAVNVYTTTEGGISNLVITKPEKEIDFDFNGSHYTINLVKHRPPKN